jgi:hypothetical protein
VSGKEIFNIHELENDSTKVLVEMDIPLLVRLMAAWGGSNTTGRRRMVEGWGFTRAESQKMEDDSQYGDEKAKVIRAFRRYLDAPPF